jgi:hypothetical protein
MTTARNDAGPSTKRSDAGEGQNSDGSWGDRLHRHSGREQGLERGTRPSSEVLPEGNAPRGAGTGQSRLSELTPWRKEEPACASKLLLNLAFLVRGPLRDLRRGRQLRKIPTAAERFNQGYRASHL